MISVSLSFFYHLLVIFSYPNLFSYQILNRFAQFFSGHCPIPMWHLFGSILCFAIASAIHTSNPCVRKNVDFGVVCVCNITYCDTLDVVMPTEENAIILITSSKDGDRFSYSIGTIANEEFNRTTNLYVDRTVLYQKIRGFGTSISGSVTTVLGKLPSKLRKSVYRSYFSRNYGLNLKLIRLPIGGCDFDIEPWAYNETPTNDVNLSSFTKLHARESQRNVRLKEIMRMSDSEIEYFAAAWGPPRWMKEIHSWDGLRNNQLKPEYFQTWAIYHLKWLKLMAKDSIHINAISSGNEPATGHIIPFQALSWNASSHAKWIVEHLKPLIQNSALSYVQIHGYDDNRDSVLFWLNKSLDIYPQFLNTISVLDIHGYVDHKTSPFILDDMNRLYQKPIVYTEMSFGGGILDGTGPKLGSWNRAEQSIQNIMSALNHYVTGYIDWNMILDSNGGPSYANNFLDAAIMTNAHFTEVYKQPLFYAMAHFSTFIPPGSVRIFSSLAVNLSQINVLSVSFLRPDNKISIVLYNNSTMLVDLKIRDTFKGIIFLKLTPKSINTLIY